MIKVYFPNDVENQGKGTAVIYQTKNTYKGSFFCSNELDLSNKGNKIPVVAFQDIYFDSMQETVWPLVEKIKEHSSKDPINGLEIALKEFEKTFN